MKKDLKKIIKEYVRQCLKEILAEQFIENVVKDVISENFLQASRPSSFKDSVLQENNTENVEQSKEEMEERKKMILNKVIDGGEVNPYASIFEDTLNSNNSILTEGKNDSDRQEIVSEAALRESGLFKNYDKFLK
jgi:hypothetical protein